jgi:glycosyltransferase involved in cell wall biosynthesis
LAVLAGRASLVHLNLSFPAGKYQLASVLVARSMRRPVLITHHLAIDVGQLGMEPHRAVCWALWIRLLGRLATSHVALSTSGRDVLTRHYGCRPSDVVVTPAFLDTGTFKPLEPDAREQARAELARGVGRPPWAAGTRVILTVARLTRQKGLLDLLDVARATARDEPRWTFVIVGEGELRARLEDEIVRRGLQDRVLLAGREPRERVRLWLGCADAFFLPSQFEGVPIAILEAIASGCPVVATEVGGVPDIGLRPPFGCTAPARAVEGLARALAQAVTWPRPDDACGRAHLLAPYDRDRCLATLLGLQRRLASSRPRQAPGVLR